MIRVVSTPVSSSFRSYGVEDRVWIFVVFTLSLVRNVDIGVMIYLRKILNHGCNSEIYQFITDLYTPCPRLEQFAYKGKGYKYIGLIF